MTGRGVTAEQIDIRAEVARVQAELLSFREGILPALFETPLDAVFGEDYADWVREKSNGRLSDWQGAQPAVWLNCCRSGRWPPRRSAVRISRISFSRRPRPRFPFEMGRIVWDIRLFVDRSLCSLYCPER